MFLLVVFGGGDGVDLLGEVLGEGFGSGEGCVVLEELMGGEVEDLGSEYVF